MLVDSSFGVKHVFIREQDAIQVSDKRYQYANLREGVEINEFQN